MSGTLAGVTSLGSEVVLYGKMDHHAVTRDWRKVDHRGPALSDRDARDEEHHSLAFLNEARGRKKTVGDGVVRRRQVHQEH